MVDTHKRATNLNYSKGKKRKKAICARLKPGRTKKRAKLKLIKWRLRHYKEKLIRA